MNLTPYKLRKIKEIIKRHSDVMLELLIGGNSSELAQKLGISKKDLDLIGYAYAYGKLESLSGLDLTRMPVKSIDVLVEKVNLTRRQANVANLLKTKAGSYATNFEQKLATSIVNDLIADNLAHPDAEPAEGIKRTLKELRQHTADFTRDWHRIIQTETWDAKLQGEIAAISDKMGPYSSKGQETLVYKRPAYNACPDCRRLYLESDGITPKVFTLFEMQAFGTNVGVKHKEWKPVIGTLHPYCQCTLNVMPDGYKFDASGQLVPK